MSVSICRPTIKNSATKCKNNGVTDRYSTNIYEKIFIVYKETRPTNDVKKHIKLLFV